MAITNPYAPFFTEDELDCKEATLDQKDKLLLLVRFVLEPIRRQFGPITITSGYRTEAHQKELMLKGYKPSPASQHMLGEAVDFVIPHVRMIDVYNWIINQKLPIGELFYYAIKGHVHVSLPNYNLVKNNALNIGIKNE